MVRWRLKEVMTDKQLGIAEVARRSGVSLRTLNIIYHNPLHVGRLSTLDRLANGLEGSPCDLIEQKNNRETARVPPTFLVPVNL